jgi:hypothetical protein
VAQLHDRYDDDDDDDDDDDNDEFSRHIFETVSNINIMKIHLVGAKLVHADRRTDITKLIVAFCNFGQAPKKDIAVVQQRD